MPTSHSVRLNILSDLHLGQGGLPLPDAQADIVVLAGDISRPREAIAWARAFSKPVLYVPGNHEFYGNTLGDTLRQLKDLSQGSQIHILDNDDIELCGVRFLGSTLWTDFNLYGPGKVREQSISQALGFIRDFVRIQSDAIPGTALAPPELETLFAIMLQFIDQVVLRARKNLYARAGKLFLQHPEVMLPVNCTVSIALHNNR